MEFLEKRIPRKRCFFFSQYTPLKSNGIYVRTLVSTGPAAKVEKHYVMQDNFMAKLE